MANKIDSRQIISRDTLSRIALAANMELDDLLRSLNAEVTPPFWLYPNAPADLVVNVGSALVTNPETLRNRTVATIGATAPTLTSGTITFPAAPGTVTIVPGNNIVFAMGANEYIKAVVYYDANDDLNLLFGSANAVEANATVLPAPDGTLAIGYITIQTIGGVVQNVTNAKIYQYVGVGGAGGSGNANELQERIKEQFEESTYEFVTPLIFASVKETETDGPNSQAVYDVVDKAYLFANVADKLTTIQELDSEFLSEERDIDRVLLSAFWKLADIDENATYKVSRNGGLEYQEVEMERVGETDTYQGFLVFEEEVANEIISQNITGGSGATEVLNITTSQQITQPFTIAATNVFKKLMSVTVNKTGSPVGYAYFEICRDNAGNPGTSVVGSAYVNIANLSAGANVIDIACGGTLAAGNYHLVAKTSSAYASSFSAGVHQITLNTRTGSSASDMKIYNGTTWAAVSGEALHYSLQGRLLDLRIEVTAGTAAVKLLGLGIFYANQGKTVTGVKNLEVFRVDGSANTTDFVVTNFQPNADFLKVYDVNSGQVYKYGSFAISGNKVIFQSGQFLSPGETIILHFEQLDGSASDSSDSNAALMGENRLGSKDATLDRSVAGEGLLLRADNGTLVELWVTWNGSSYDINISEV